MKRISIFLITVALIAGMVGCGGTTPAKYSLTMAVVGGNGTATDLTNASPYAAGTIASIKAVASVGYHFVNWTAPAGTFGNATATQTTFTMPAQNVTVTANFAMEIWDWYDLDAVRDNLGSSYILMNDLDSTSAGYDELASASASDGKGWQPIGTFIGVFDGQGYEIRDLFINRPDEDHVGLFGYAAAGVIEDVNVVNVTMTGLYFVGGLVGQNGDLDLEMNGATVSNSYSTGNVTGASSVGGLVGYNGGVVSSSNSNTSATAKADVGGLVGWNRGTVNDSYSTGSVSAITMNGTTENPNRAGGLVGANDLMGNISNSYSTSSVTGCAAAVGGLVGQNVATISNSYSTGNVTGHSDVGGLVGHNPGTIINSYAIGSVTGVSSVGGLVGWNPDGTVINSFWDTENSGQPTSDGGTGKNTTEMRDLTTFSGASWDIAAVANFDIRNTSYIWNIVDNVTYPFLSWQPA
jgi:uncharacterized repeat protein (TIGR02543 family)